MAGGSRRTLMWLHEAGSLPPLPFGEPGTQQRVVRGYDVRPSKKISVRRAVGVLDQRHLVVQAVCRTAVRFGAAPDSRACEEPSVSFEVKEVLCRIAREALNSVAKHAHASHVTLRLGASPTAGGGGELVLEVQDDGVGFDPQGEHPGHLGLRSMEERAARVGGTLSSGTPGYLRGLARARYTLRSWLPFWSWRDAECCVICGGAGVRARTLHEPAQESRYCPGV